MPYKPLLTILAIVLAGVAAHGEPPVQAVVITGDHPFTLDTFLAAFEGHEGVEFTHAPQQNHEEIFDNIRDWPYDVMVFYHFSMEIPPHRLQNLLALLEQGVGLVVMHHGGMTYWNVEELRDVYGIRWNPPDFVFHMDQDYTAHIVDPEHPITKGLEDFPVHDETYTGFQFDDYPGNHTLITADHPNSDNVIAWTRYYGKTRVAGFQPGHDTPVFANPAFKTIMGRMTLWAAGHLPDEPGGPFLKGTTIYRENREGWLDEQLLSGVSGSPRIAHDEIHRRVLAAHNDLDARRALALRLAALLEREGTADGKRFILRQLAYLRSPEAVPAISAMLGDPVLGDMARGTLEGYPGEAVDQALTHALGNAEGEARIGILNSLARRGGKDAVADLAEVATSSDAATAAAALDALASAASDEAVEALLARLHAGDNATFGPLLLTAEKALEEGRADVAMAIVEAVKPASQTLPDPLRRIYYSVMLASRPGGGLALAADYATDPDAQARMAAYAFLSRADTEGGKVLAELHPDARADEQVIILAGIRRMNATSVAPTVRNALLSGNESVRVEAVRTLASVGDESDVPRLFTIALEGTDPEAKAARAVLATLSGVNASVAARTVSASPAEAALALELLAARKATEMTDLVYAQLASGDDAVREKAWETAGILTGPEELEQLQSRVVADHRVPAALARVARKADDLGDAVDALFDYPYANDATRALALTAVAHLAGEHALERLSHALAEPTPAVQEAALRALMAWPTPAPAPSLLAFAKRTSSAGLRREALAAYVEHTQLDGAVTPAGLMERLREAYTIADETTTRERILEAAGKSGHTDGLVLLREAMGEPTLKQAAMRSILRLAGLVAADHPDESLASLRHVVDAAEDEGFRAEARAVFAEVEQYRGRLLAHWSFSAKETDWRAENDCDIRLEDGVLNIRTSGGDPHIVVDTFVPAGPAEVVMRAQFDVMGPGQFFWVYDDQPGYGLDSPFTVFELMQHENGWVDFRIPVNFERPIKSFRLDPGMDADGTVLIDYIRIEKTSP